MIVTALIWENISWYFDLSWWYSSRKGKRFAFSCKYFARFAYIRMLHERFFKLQFSIFCFRFGSKTDEPNGRNGRSVRRTCSEEAPFSLPAHTPWASDSSRLSEVTPSFAATTLSPQTPDSGDRQEAPPRPLTTPWLLSRSRRRSGTRDIRESGRLETQSTRRRSGLEWKLSRGI